MFSLPTETATTCLKLARSMVSALGESSNDFAEWLCSSLTKIIKDSGSSKKPNKEKLWRQFHVIRSSDSFIKHWESFMEQLKLKPLPLFIQHVTQEVFETILIKNFSAPVLFLLMKFLGSQIMRKTHLGM